MKPNLKFSRENSNSVQRLAKIFIFALTTVRAVAQVPLEIQTYRQEPLGNYSSVCEGILGLNGVRTWYFNTSEIGTWPGVAGAEWPRGTGHNYIEGVSILLGAKIRLSGGKVITPIEGHFRGWFDFDPALGGQARWDLEPVPGYNNPMSTVPAISNNPQSWPDSWNNRWHGIDGIDSLHGELETFFVVDDSKDAEFARPPYNFYPLLTDSSRKGLGLRVEIRGFQWKSDSLAKDMEVFVYDVVNLSDCDYDTMAFGMLFVPGVGSSSQLPNQNVSWSEPENMLVGSATGGVSGAPYNWKTGYVGLVVLETPARPVAETGPAGIGGFATHSRLDHGLSGFDLRNDSTLWFAMTSGFSDTLYNDSNEVAVLGTEIFSMPKWTKRRFSVAFVFAQDRDSLSMKAALARQIALAGYHLAQSPTGVDRLTSINVPTSISLSQNYPNPFNPTTTIRYQIPTASKVIIGIYNVLGQEIATIVDEQQQAGRYSVKWDASHVPSGVFLCVLHAGPFVQTKKLLLLK